MADIDDVMDKLDDVMDKLDDVLEKIDEVASAVSAARNITRVCTACFGNGYLEVWNDTGGDPSQVTCSLCNGDKKIYWGYQEEL